VRNSYLSAFLPFLPYRNIPSERRLIEQTVVRGVGCREQGNSSVDLPTLLQITIVYWLQHIGDVPKVPKLLLSDVVCVSCFPMFTTAGRQGSYISIGRPTAVTKNTVK